MQLWFSRYKEHQNVAFCLLQLLPSDVQDPILERDLVVDPERDLVVDLMGEGSNSTGASPVPVLTQDEGDQETTPTQCQETTPTQQQDTTPTQQQETQRKATLTQQHEWELTETECEPTARVLSLHEV